MLECALAFYNEAQRFEAWRSGGFLAQKFNRSTALDPTTKLSYEAQNPPLRQTAVTGSKFSVRHFVSIIFCSFIFRMKSAILCVSFIEKVGLK